jgi:O-antigen/teichoic acid export membrane protein
LSRLYTATDFGLFTIYLSIVNLGGPMLSLKFDSALYAAGSREEAAKTLLLALVTVMGMSCLSSLAIWICFDAIVGSIGEASAFLLYLLPIGLLLSGAWSISSAWAVRTEAASTLGVARLLQPLSMTILQLSAGAFAPSGPALVVAHLFSHFLYSAFVAGSAIRRNDLAAMRGMSLGELLARAARLRSFPLFVLPAQLSTLCVGNLPPILLSILYGAGVAGNYGVAYRLVAAPLTVASMPLGAVFMGSLMRANSRKERAPLVRKVFLVNLVLVGLPVVALGALATPLAPLALGPNWTLTGQMITALCLLGAAQAIAAPFAETTSVFKAQRLRLLIESAGAAVVVTTLVVSAAEKIDALRAVWFMSIGGAAVSLLGLAFVVGRIEQPSLPTRI